MLLSLMLDNWGRYLLLPSHTERGTQMPAPSDQLLYLQLEIKTTPVPTACWLSHFCCVTKSQTQQFKIVNTIPKAWNTGKNYSIQNNFICWIKSIPLPAHSQQTESTDRTSSTLWPYPNISTFTYSWFYLSSICNVNMDNFNTLPRVGI